MNELSKLRKPKGATKDRVRVGRGQSSGLGKTSGKGGKGQKARVGNMHFEGFEGGQTPLQRRTPKRGFVNIHRKTYEIVKLEELGQFAAGQVVDVDRLVEAGLVRDAGKLVKVLGDGELGVSLTVRAHGFTASARSKIEAAGGKAELLEKGKAGEAAPAGA